MFILIFNKWSTISIEQEEEKFVSATKWWITLLDEAIKTKRGTHEMEFHGHIRFNSVSKLIGLNGSRLNRRKKNEQNRHIIGLKIEKNNPSKTANRCFSFDRIFVLTKTFFLLLKIKKKVSTLGYRSDSLLLA